MSVVSTIFNVTSLALILASFLTKPSPDRQSITWRF